MRGKQQIAKWIAKVVHVTAIRSEGCASTWFEYQPKELKGQTRLYNYSNKLKNVTDYLGKNERRDINEN